MKSNFVNNFQLDNSSFVPEILRKFFIAKKLNQNEIADKLTGKNFANYETNTRNAVIVA